jgi:Fuc2NAc and GlcNAc transferase
MYAFYFLFGTAASWILLWRTIPLLRRRLLDQPNARSSHRVPTPRGGGIAFVSVSTLVLIFASLCDNSPLIRLPLLAFPLAVVGLLDDRYNLPASWRYIVQILTAISILTLSPLVRSLVYPWILAGVLFLIIVTGIINFINFMDGLDGLVAGSMLIAISASLFQLHAPSSTWILPGALLGFLFWNWSPAHVFMGDSGSTFLGAIFAGLVLQAPTWSDALSLLCISTPLLADACFCVIRRAFSGQPIFQAHRLHLFQRLHQAGWHHQSVSFLYIVATLVLALASCFGGSIYVLPLAVLVLLIGVCLDRFVAVPFSVSFAPSD